MTDLTGKEKLMYQVMGTIADAGIPLVYKGAMITKLLLIEHDFNAFSRETQDIDASWDSNLLPTMEELAEALGNALSAFGLRAVAKRDYGDKKSAGFNIIDETNGEPKMSVDIDMRPEKDSRTYQLGDIAFRGTTVDHILSDKIHVLSTDKAYRRVKDAVDVYALSLCVAVKSGAICAIWRDMGRTPGAFEAFSSRCGDLEHAYKKLRRVEPKPDFGIVFSHLKLFLAPFIEKNTCGLVWDNAKQGWEQARF